MPGDTRIDSVIRRRDDQLAGATPRLQSDFGRLGTTGKALHIAGVVLTLGGSYAYHRAEGFYTRKLEIPTSTDAHTRTEATAREWAGLREHVKSTRSAPQAPTNAVVPASNDKQIRAIATKIIQAHPDGTRLRPGQFTTDQLSRLAEQVGLVGPTGSKDGKTAGVLADLHTMQSLDAEAFWDLETLDMVRREEQLHPLIGDIVQDLRPGRGTPPTPASGPAIATHTTAADSRYRASGSLRGLIAEVLFASDPSLMSGVTVQARRIRNVLIEDAAAIAHALQAPDRAVQEFPVDLQPMARQFLARLDEMTSGPVSQWAKDQTGKRVSSLSTEHLTTALKTALRALPESDFEWASGCFDDQIQGFKFQELGSAALSSLVPDDQAKKSPLSKFIKNVLSTYFGEQPVIDKRAMVAGFLRSKGADQDDAQKLVALVRGAGPFLLKLLQLMGDKAQDPHVKQALDTVKSELSPIDSGYVKAVLLRIVEDSQTSGADPFIEKITLTQTLGAASVGEAMLARLSMSDNSQRDVVLKILRPGIAERAQREMPIFQNAARMNAGGEGQAMLATFEGIAKQVNAELDLRAEAENVVSSQVYSRADHPEVAAMKIAPDTPVDARYLMLNRAPGKTVKSVLDELPRLPESDPAAITAALNQFEKRADSASVSALGASLSSVVETWLSEAIFGSGFYHGDLHTGNMMFGKGTGADSRPVLTLIDMGNAKKLSPDERKCILRMMAAGHAGQPVVFIEQLKKTLSLAGAATLDRSRAAYLAGLEDMFRRHQAPGTRIILALELATKMSIEVPEVVMNFARSEQMLEDAFARFNEINQHNAATLEKLSTHVGSQMPATTYSAWEGAWHALRTKELSRDECLDLIGDADEGRLMAARPALAQRLTEAEMIAVFGALDTLLSLRAQIQRLQQRQPAPISINNSVERSITSHLGQTVKNTAGVLHQLVRGRIAFEPEVVDAGARQIDEQSLDASRNSDSKHSARG